MTKMRIRILALFILFISTHACDDDDFVKSDCAIYLIDNLDTWENSYGLAMIEPDSEGNDQSLEACIQRRNYTVAYKERLKEAQTDLNANDGCSGEEKFDLNNQIFERISELEEDLVNIWNRCEEIFGDD